MSEIVSLQLTAHGLALALSLALFLGLWPISVQRRDASVVDAVWGPGFALIAWLVWALNGAPDDLRAMALLALVTLWSARLTMFLMRRKMREPEEDPRYAKLRAAWEPGFWWKSAFVVFGLQAVLQWVLTLAVQRALLAPPAPLELVALIGVGVAVVGLVIEAVADAQLDRFRRANPRPALFDRGLWGWSRHPNYFGEIVFWWGIWLIAAPVAELWTIVAPLLVTGLLRYVSGVPMLETHLRETRPEFARYEREVPMLIPWPPSRTRGRSTVAEPR